MQTEFEIKVLDISVQDMLTTLRSQGLQEESPQDFKRYVYDLPDNKAWIRLRTDGVKTTLTHKLFEKNAIDGVQELEIEVSDFQKTHELLLLMGLQASSYQENKRRRFTAPDVEVSIDEWPLIPAYLEIEGETQAVVEQYITKLDLQDSRTTSEPTSAVYQLYGLDLTDYPELSFTLSK